MTALIITKWESGCAYPDILNIIQISDFLM